MKKLLSTASWWLLQIRLWMFYGFAISANAQNTPVNLVPNGGFEVYNWCPTISSGLNACSDWTFEVPSADYFHICGTLGAGVPSNVFGSQMSIGDAYIGLASYYTGFAGNQEVAVANLESPLISGEKYRVRLKASYADSANYSVCCLGAILSSTPPPAGPYNQNLSSVELVLLASEFDTTTWFQLDQVYTAQGGEDKIYLGTFRPESEMNPINVRPNGSGTYDIAYFYIDDVEVYEDTVTGIDETDNQQVSLVYDQGILTVHGNMAISVFDLNGRVVREGRSSLDVSGLIGVYLVQVLDDGVPVHTQKMVFGE